jgi:hypothetical protein
MPIAISRFARRAGTGATVGDGVLGETASGADAGEGSTGSVVVTLRDNGVTAQSNR